MKTILTSALIIATLSGAAFASTPVAGVSAGAAQMALALGVEPGRFTTNELLDIQDAKHENDQFRLNAILSGANRPTGDRGVTAGKAQLAALIGVNPADYTLAQLTAMQRVPDSSPSN
jgi:hypothetical protein